MKRLLTIILLVSCSAAAYAEWQSLPAPPVARVEAMTAVEANGAVYLIGGSDRHEADAAVYRYGSEGAWQAVASMPYPLTQGAAVFLDGKIYLAGGFDGRVLRPELLHYDIAADIWNVGPAVPEGRFGYSLEALDGKLYLTGGASLLYESVGDNCWRYDPAASTWEELSPMNTPRKQHGSAVLDGKLAVFGGISFDAGTRQTLTSMEIYNQADDSWTAGAPMPVAFAQGASGMAGNAGWACGGWQDGSLSPSCYVYHADTASWTTGEAAPFGAFRMAAGGGLPILAGGETIGDRGFQIESTVAIWQESVTDDDDDNDDNDDTEVDDDFGDNDTDDDASPNDDDDPSGDDDAAGAGSDDDDDGEKCGC